MGSHQVRRARLRVLLPLTLLGAGALALGTEDRYAVARAEMVTTQIVSRGVRDPRVLDALRSFGAPLFDLSIDDLTRPEVVFQIGVVPVRIDLLTSISGGANQRRCHQRRCHQRRCQA